MGEYPTDCMRQEANLVLNFNSILLFSENPRKLKEFYRKIFRKKPDWSEGDYYGFMTGKGFITIGPHDKVRGKSRNPERIMFNLERSLAGHLDLDGCA